MALPSFKQTDNNDFPMAFHANKSYREDEEGNVVLDSVEVVGDAYPNHKLRYDVRSTHVTVESRGAVPYGHHIQLVNKLSEALNKAAQAQAK
jgi:hypothetical protein